jgi:hypothetical protein
MHVKVVLKDGRVADFEHATDAVVGHGRVTVRLGGPVRTFGIGIVDKVVNIGDDGSEEVGWQAAEGRN